jgi:hypothetical protein
MGPSVVGQTRARHLHVPDRKGELFSVQIEKLFPRKIDEDAFVLRNLNPSVSGHVEVLVAISP